MTEKKTMYDPLRDVAEFHEAKGHPISAGEGEPDKDNLAETEQLLRAHELANELRGTLHELSKKHPTSHLAFRLALFSEEFAEWFEAIIDRDDEAALDAHADMNYVLHGNAVTFGWDLREAHARVHEANMSKVESGQETEKPTKAEDFKAPTFDDLVDKPTTREEFLLEGWVYYVVPRGASLQKLADLMADFERMVVRQVLRDRNGNRTEAARRLGCTREALYKKMKRLEIEDV